MLQINSGKLYARGVGRRNALTGVLFTNARFSLDKPLETLAGALRSTGYGQQDRACVFDMEERIEAEEENRPGILISHTIDPFLNDFAVVATFGLGAVFSRDAQTARVLTGGEAGFSSYRPASEFIARHFDPTVFISEEEAADFKVFVGDLLGLKRKTFLAVMRAMRTFVAGLHRLPDDLALAYTLMVSAVEALAQDFDGHTSAWSDVAERKRDPIDEALVGLEPEVRDTVRAAVLKGEHVALARRYRAFMLARVDASYFRTESVSGARPVARYELESALRQAYDFRSAYLHRLAKLPDPLSHPFAHWESTDVERRPALTFQGLYRLSRHVVRRFMAEQPKVEVEVYPSYRNEEAGVVMMSAAPQYWIWQNLVDTGGALRRLEGLLQLTTGQLKQETDSLYPDMRPVLAEVEKLVDQAPRAHRTALIWMYFLYTLRVPPEYRPADAQAFVEKHSDEAAAAGPQTIAPNLIFNETGDWSIEAHQRALDDYFVQRVRPSGLHAPRLLEAAMCLDLAEKYRVAGATDVARELLARAVEIQPEHAVLRQAEIGFASDKPIDWRTVLLPERPMAAGEGEKA